MNTSLIKDLLLIKDNNNYDNNTERNNTYIKVGQNLYMFRTLYIIAKNNLYKDKTKKFHFYLKLKNEDKKPIFYPKPKDKDILIDDYKELKNFILNSIVLLHSSIYKVYIYTSNLFLIENNEELLSYKGKVIYSKITEYINENNKINFYFKSPKNIIRKRLYNEESKKYNSLPSFNKLAFNNTLLINHIKMKNNYKNYLNKSNIIKNYKKKLFMIEDKTKNKKYKTIEYKKNNNYNFNNNDKSNLEEKSDNSTLKNNKSNFSDLIKSITNNNLFQDNINKNYDSIKSTINNFYKGNEINENKNSINDRGSIYSYNYNHHYILSKIKKNKSKLEIDVLKKRNNILLKKLFYDDKYNKYKNNTNKKLNSDIKNIFFESNIYKDKNIDKDKSKDEDIDKSKDKDKIIKDKNLNLKIRLDFDISRNKIYENKPSSSLLIRRKNSLMNLKPKYIDKGNQIEIIHKKEKVNQSNILKNKKKDNEGDIMTIRHFLKTPSIKKGFFKKDDIENNEKNLDNIKHIYNECLLFLNHIINNINNFFSEKEINFFISHLDYSYRQKYNFINMHNCLKQFLLFSYLNNYIKKKYPLILTNIFVKINYTNNDYIELESILIYLLNEIKERIKNKDFKLIEYIQSIKKLQNIKITTEFFFIFVLCSNFFNKFHREIARKILLLLKMKQKIYFEDYVNYYVYFKENKLISLEMKMNFITKFLYIIQGGCADGQALNIVKKFMNDILFQFKIDNRTREKLLGKIYEIKFNYHMIAKINEIFASLVNFFEVK